MEKIIKINFIINEYKPEYRFCGHFCLLFLRKFYDMYKEDDLETMKKYSWNSGLGFISPISLYNLAGKLDMKLVKNTYNREFIQDSINNGKPVIQFVSHGYMQDLIHWSRIRAIFLQHFVIIYGYDDIGYWCYDPAKHKPNEIAKVHIPYIMMEKSVKWSGLGVFSSGMSFY